MDVEEKIEVTMDDIRRFASYQFQNCERLEYNDELLIVKCEDEIGHDCMDPWCDGTHTDEQAIAFYGETVFKKFIAQATEVLEKEPYLIKVLAEDESYNKGLGI